MDLTLSAQGDLHIDAHHTTEDTGWAIGAAERSAWRTAKVFHDMRMRICRWMNV